MGCEYQSQRKLHHHYFDLPSCQYIYTAERTSTPQAGIMHSKGESSEIFFKAPVLRRAVGLRFNKWPESLKEVLKGSVEAGA